VLHEAARIYHPSRRRGARLPFVTASPRAQQAGKLPTVGLMSAMARLHTRSMKRRPLILGFRMAFGGCGGMKKNAALPSDRP